MSKFKLIAYLFFNLRPQTHLELTLLRMNRWMLRQVKHLLNLRLQLGHCCLLLLRLLVPVLQQMVMLLVLRLEQL